MIIKKAIHQGVLAILNVYVVKNRNLKYVEQKLIQLKRKLHKFTIIVRDISPL